MINSRKRIVVLLSGLVVLFVMILGVSYAYYVADISGNTSTDPSLTLKSGYLAITYADGTSAITGGSSGTTTEDLVYTKNFSITNSGVADTYYAVGIKNYQVLDSEGNVTVLENPEYWTYDLKVGDTSIASGTLPTSDSALMASRILAVDATENLTLTVTFDYSETEVQNADMNKTLEFNVSVVQTKVA